MSNKVVIVGAGNVAHHLSIALYKAGFKIAQVFSRRRHRATGLAKKVNAASTTSLSRLLDNADLYILAVSDDAIEEVVSKLDLPTESIVVHTSGSVSSKIITNKFSKGGVLYPLQTFSKGVKVKMMEVPICVHSPDKGSLTHLKKVGRKISRKVQEIDDQQRQIIHVAAVFANNFTNHIYSVAEHILEADKMKLDILHPLIKETVDKAIRVGPEAGQTGPAVRDDQVVIKKHLSLLKDQPQYRKLYKILTESIQKNS